MSLDNFLRQHDSPRESDIRDLLNGHLWRDIVPSGRELGRIGRTVWDHLRLRFPSGDEARHYNVLQKLSYLIMIVVVLPVLVLAGLGLSLLGLSRRQRLA